MELIIFRDAREVGRLRLSEGAFSIGRGLHNTIALDDHSISRRHARLHVRDGHVEVEDLSSINGTWLGGQPVREATLQDGDILTIGPFSLEIRLEDEDVVIHDGLDSTQPGKELVEVATVTHPVGIHALASGAAAPAGADADFSMLAEGSEEGDAEHEAMHPHDFLGLNEDDWMDHTLRPAPQGAPAARAKAPAPTPPEPAARPKLERSKASIRPKSSPDFVFDDDGGPDNSGRHDATRPNPRLPKTVDLASSPKPGRKGTPKGQSSQLAHPDGPRLEVREGQALQPVMELARRTLYIGRAEEMDLVLLDSNASRRHAAIHWEDDTVFVKDIWSMNGIKVNGEKVQYAELKPGDRLQVGDTVLEFLWPGAPAPTSLSAREVQGDKTWVGLDNPTIPITAQQIAAAQAHPHEPLPPSQAAAPVAHPPVPAPAPLSVAAALEPPKSARASAPPVAPSVRTSSAAASPPQNAGAPAAAVKAAPAPVPPVAGTAAPVPAVKGAAPQTASSVASASAVASAGASAASVKPAVVSKVGAPVQPPQKSGLSTPTLVAGALLLALAVGAGAAMLKRTNTGSTLPEPVAALPGEPAVLQPLSSSAASAPSSGVPVVSSPAPALVDAGVTPVPSPVVAMATSASAAPPVEVTPAPARAASVPVASVPVASVPVASVPVASVPVASVPVASVPVASVSAEVKPASAPSSTSSKTSAPIAEPAARVAMVAAPAPTPKPGSVLGTGAPPKVERPTAPVVAAGSSGTSSTAAGGSTTASSASSTASSGSRTASVVTGVANTPASNPVVAKTPGAPSRADVEKRMNSSYQSGLVAQKQGRLQEAIKLFEKALAEDPRRESELYYQIEDDIQTTRARLHEQVRPMVSEATALAERGQLAEARQQLQDAVNRAPDYQAAASRLKQVEAELTKQGNKLLAGGESREQAGALSEAETLYKQVLTLVQDKSHPLYQRAVQRLDLLKQKK